MRRPSGRVVVACGLLLWAAVARAGGETEYQSGVKAYQDGRMDAAREEFEKAREAGYAKPDLHQSLGSVYLRLGRLDEAEAEFKALASNAQWAPLAYYNLAAVELARDDKAAAADWYQRAYQTSSNETLRSQAAMQLDKLGERPREKRFALSLSASGGYDSNITVSGLEEELVDIESNSDDFMDYSATVGMRLWGDAHHGMRLLGSVLYRDYRDINRFDQGVARGGVAYDRKIGAVHAEAGVMGESTVLDGEQVQRAGIGYLQGAYPLDARQSVRLRYEGQRLDGDQDFEFLTGWQHSLGTEYLVQWATVGFSLGYTYEHNDRDDRTRDFVLLVPQCLLLGLFCTDVPFPLEEFASFSPRRHRGQARVVWKPAVQWTVQAQAEYQDSHYRDEDTVTSPGLGELFAVRRKEHRTTVGLGAERRFGAHWAVTGDYAYTDNRSNFEAYDYERNLVRLGVGFLY
jgi:hypothetical protein